MSRTARIEAVTAAARALDSAIRGLSDEELLAEATAVEGLIRLAEARGAALAAEVQWRSRPQLRDAGLAARQGERNGVDLLVKECRISTREARRRIAIGAALAPRLSLTGEEVEGRFPALAAAVTAGSVPLDSARIIVDTLAPLRRRVPLEELTAAEEALTEEATGTSPDLVLIQAVQWAMRLDQDGAKPSEEQARAERAFRWGARAGGGARRFSGVCPAEEEAELQAALVAHRKGVRMTCEGDDPQDGDGDGLPQWREADGDHRTTAQLDFDILVAYLRAGVRAETEGAGGSLKTAHEVVTVVTAEDLERRQGGGHPLGVLARFSLPTVERLACGGSSRLLVTGGNGEPLWPAAPLGSSPPGRRRPSPQETAAAPGLAAPPRSPGATPTTCSGTSATEAEPISTTVSPSARITTTSSTRRRRSRFACTSGSPTWSRRRGRVRRSPITGCNSIRSTPSGPPRSGGCDRGRARAAPDDPGRLPAAR